jgi:TP901 family phage tail tape measure protein
VSNIIAEAFVAVRPDLSGFARELRALVQVEVDKVKAPTIKLRPVLDKDALALVRRQVSAIRVPITVVPRLDSGAAAELRRQIQALGTIPLPVSVRAETRVVDARSGRSGGGAGRIPDEERLAQLRRQVSAATSEATKRTFELGDAQKRLQDAQRALSGTQTAYDAAVKRGTASSIKAVSALRSEAEATVRLARARVDVLALREGSFSATAGVDRTAALEQEKVARKNLADAMALESRVAQTNNVALERTYRSLVKRREGELAAASAIRATSQAEVDATVAATARAATATAERAGRRAQQTALTNISERAASIDLIGANAKTRAGTASAQLRAAIRLEEEAEASLSAIREKANISRNRANILLLDQATRLHRVTEALLANKTAEAAAAPFRDRLLSVQGLVDDAAVAKAGRTAVEAASAQARAATIAQKYSAALLADATAAATLDKVLLRQIVILNEQAVALGVSSAASLEAAKAAAVHGRSASQASRGIIATSATFLGLRGAVLASSLPFLAATIAVTAFAKVVGSAGDLQRSLREFQAVSGANAVQMEQVSRAAKELGADLSLPSISAQDAATAMTELAKAGLSVQDAMDATRSTLQLSVAANLGVGEAAKIAASQLNAFDLAGTEAQRVTDLLAGASIAAQGEIADFAKAFQQTSSVAKQAGLSVEQTTTFLTQLAKAGIQGSDAGTSLRVMLTRLVPTTKTARQGFADLGIEINKTQTLGQQLPSIIDQFSDAIAKLDPQEASAIVRDIFGQDAQRAAFELLTEGSEVFNLIQSEVSESGKAAQLTEAKVKGLTGAMDGLGSTTEDLATTTGKVFVPAVTAAAKAMTDIIATTEDLVSAIAPLVKLLGKPIEITIGGEAAARIGLIAGAAFLLRRRFFAVRAAADAASASVVGFGAANTAATASSVAGTALIARGWTSVTGAIGKATAAARANKGLIAGVGGVAAGETIGGEAGNVASAAGTGALIGSFFPGPGTAVGAVTGALFGITTNAIARSKQEKEKRVAQWDALTREEQLNVVTENGWTSAHLAILGFKVKPGTFSADTFNFPAPISAASAADPGRAAIEFLFTPIVDSKAVVAATNAIRAGKDVTTSLAVAEAQAFGTDAEVVKALKRRNVYVKRQIELLRDQVSEGELRDRALRQISDALKGLLGEFTSNADQISRLIADSLNAFSAAQGAADVASARARGTETLSDDLSSAQEQQRIITEKYEKLAADTTTSAEDLNTAKLAVIAADNEVNDVLRSIKNEREQAQQETQSILDDQVQAQEIALARAAASAANFGSAQQRYIDFLRDQVAAAKEGTAAYQQAISAVQSAEQAQTNAQLQLLQLQAEEAGHRGRAELALIALLRERVQKAKGNALLYEQAQAALRAEQQRFADARDQSRQLGFDVRRARIQTARAAAALTDTKADDLAVERRELAVLDALLKDAFRKKTAAKKGTDEYKRAILEIQSLLQARIAVQKAIKDLLQKDEDLGPDLISLFAEANRIFQEFAPNIQLTPEGEIANLFGPGVGGGGPAAVTIDQKEERLAKALDENTAALLDVGDGIGTTVTVEQNFPPGSGDDGASTSRSAQYARHAVRGVFDG